MHKSMQEIHLVSNRLYMDYPMLIDILMRDTNVVLQKLLLKMLLNICQHLLNAERLHVSRDIVEGTVQNETMLVNNLQLVGM